MTSVLLHTKFYLSLLTSAKINHDLFSDNFEHVNTGLNLVQRLQKDFNQLAIVTCVRNEINTS